MIHTTYNNHVKFYTNDELYGNSKDINRKYRLEFGSIDKEYYQRSNYYEELKRVADLQYNLFGKDLIVFLSGGLDSEIVVRTFLNIGVKVRCVIVRFVNPLNPGVIENALEVNAAIETAKKIGANYELYDFDIYNFYMSGEAKEMAVKYTCDEFAIVVYYKMCMIYASNPCIFCCEVILEKEKIIILNPNGMLDF